MRLLLLGAPDGAVVAVRQRVQVLIDTDGRAGRGELDAGAPSLGPRPPRVRQGAAAAEGGCLDEGDRCRGQLLVEGEELYECTRERRRGARGVRTGRKPPQGSALADKSRALAPRAWSPAVRRDRVVLGRAGIIRRAGRRLVGVGWSTGTGGWPTT